MEQKYKDLFTSLSFQTNFRPAVHLEHIKINDYASGLLSGILERDICAEGERSDFYDWSITITGGVTKDELEKLYDVIGADEHDRYTQECEAGENDDDSAAELIQRVSNKLFTQIMPFKIAVSFADEDGVWFFGDFTDSSILNLAETDIDTPDTKIGGADKNHYYEVHIFFDRNDGYSRFFESGKYLKDDNEILEEAIKMMPDLKTDINHYDYAREITKQEYDRATENIPADDDFKIGGYVNVLPCKAEMSGFGKITGYADDDYTDAETLGYYIVDFGNDSGTCTVHKDDMEKVNGDYEKFKEELCGAVAEYGESSIDLYYSSDMVYGMYHNRKTSFGVTKYYLSAMVPKDVIEKLCASLDIPICEE